MAGASRRVMYGHRGCLALLAVASLPFTAEASGHGTTSNAEGGPRMTAVAVIAQIQSDDLVLPGKFFSER